jgi:hypothetical protein
MSIMRRIVNVIPNDHSSEKNDDGEPSIAVNPNNPDEMVITTFTPPDPGHPYGPVFYSSDGGENWSLKFDVPGGEPRDQSICFASTSNELYMATLPAGTNQLDVMRSADPLIGVDFPPLETHGSIGTDGPDQPWVEAISVIGGPFDGKDCLYVGYHDQTHRPQTATVDVCLDARAANPVFNQVRLETRATPPGQDGMEIRPTVHPDGTVYIAYKGYRHATPIVGTTNVAVTTDIVVVRDDNWGEVLTPFTDLTDPGDGKAGRLVATGVVINLQLILGGIRTGNDLSIAVDPTDSDVVYIVWCDNAGPNYTLRVRRSQNRGVDWSGDLIAVDNAALACLAINYHSTVGLLYQQLVSGKLETHFRTTTNGTNWDDTLMARTDTTTTAFLGDYTRLLSVGLDFYGVFPAMNTPDPANFFPNGGGTFRYQRQTQGTSLVGADPSVDPFFFKIQEEGCAPFFFRWIAAQKLSSNSGPQLI